MKTKTINSDMSPTEIRVALLRAGKTQAGIAREISAKDGLPCCRVHVTRVIDGLAVSHRVRCGVADAIGIPVNLIWRDYYHRFTPCKRGRRFSGPDRQRSAA